MENIAKTQNNTFFENIKKVHFIGVGGVSLSALCLMTKNMGISVTGSDIAESDEVDKLRRAGVDVAIGHSADNIATDVDMVVYSGAIKQDNVEYVEAVNRQIALVERSQYLGEIAKTYDNVIAVAGSHGKTTTTAMIAHIFIKSGRKPTVHLGGEAIEYGNLVLGDSKYFITEACEYRNSMAYIGANVGVVTNIDNDHLDYYKTKKNLIKAFVNFANNAKDYIFVSSERKFRQIGRRSTLVSVGLNNNQNVYAYDIKSTKKGYKFSVVYNGEKLGNFKINILGKHNVKNAIFAIAIAYTYGIKLTQIRRALKSFKGVKRRYEKIGEYHRIPVISDYAHHPTEIRSSILGLKQRYNNILVVFQPHTYSRTEICIDDFAGAFRGTKSLIIYKTFPAREPYNANGDEVALYKRVVNRIKTLAQDEDTMWQAIDKYTNKYSIDAIVLMGAGDMPIKVSKEIARADN